MSTEVVLEGTIGEDKGDDKKKPSAESSAPDVPDKNPGKQNEAGSHLSSSFRRA